MRYPVWASTRLGRLKTKEGWEQFIPQLNPLVMVTLGVNAPMSEDKLMKSMKRALFRVDQKRLGHGTQPCRRINPSANALIRTNAIMLPEKVDANAHVHMLVYSPMINRNPDSDLVRKMQLTRIKDDFLGYGRTYDRPSSFQFERDKASFLEEHWRRCHPSGHYHARWTDGTDFGAGYILKELIRNWDRDVWISQMFWPDDQRNAEFVFTV